MEHIREIENKLRELESDMYEASTEYRKLAYDAALKRATYDVDYAKELLSITNKNDTAVKMTVAEREAITVKAVESQLRDCRIAEALADASKRHLGVLQSLLSSVQTRASLIKTERSLVSGMT